MRLHHLQMSAFGPFAGTVDVDFDELSAGGVFLLTGATGAGKTSVLDAVCFALYGQVPGDRAGARHLRSDHAAPGVAPRVVLEASIAERTFRFTRSPAWSRPKRRGSGETRVQAHVVVEERRDGTWVGLTSRLDDAGLLVGDLLGMTAAQFTQVAMLPQGRFQSFLRASSTERHAVLQKLFRTDRFEHVERWLVDRRGTARRAAEAAAEEVVEVLNRFQEAAGVEAPDSWGAELVVAADRGGVATWSERVVAAAREAHVVAAGELDAAVQSLIRSEAALADGRSLADLQRRSEDAARRLIAQAARADELAALRERLDAHRRAAPLTGYLSHARECHRRLGQATGRWAACAPALDGRVDDPPSGRRLPTLLEEAVTARAVAQASRPRAEELTAARARRSTLAEHLAGLTACLASLEKDMAGHPAASTMARAALDEARGAASQLPGREREAARLDELVLADHRREVVLGDLASACQELAEATELALTAKEHYLDVREARINGMAAELAGALAVGCACPVCGSASHPSPAPSDRASVGHGQEDAARRAHEDAAFVQQGHEVRVATLTVESDALAARLTGVDRETLLAQQADAQRTLRATEALASECESRAERLAALETRAEAAREERARLLLDQTATRSDLDACSATVTQVSAELAALFDDDTGQVFETADLEALIARHTQRCTQLENAMRVFTAYDEAERAATEADHALEAAAHDAGFEHRDAARAAMLPDNEAVGIETALTTAEADRLAAETTLAEPAVRKAVGRPAPDLDVLVVRQRLAAEATRAATSARDEAANRQSRVATLDQQLRARLDAWQPLRARHDLVAQLAQLVEGKGPDNPQRIRLASFVLVERLRQVVAAANERLAGMTGQRYSLEHSDDRGAGELRGGLSLRVRDDWSGLSRDPATLSGGETFVVSLALALGLADTVAHEAGGTDVDTLFIDEGFGSLDPETLEDVMDTLDTLRDGGRVVGLVSHVPELRSRITTQLEVVKGRAGSSLRPVLAGG
jgi:DNA repair protein SbcC/Rad50